MFPQRSNFLLYSAIILTVVYNVLADGDCEMYTENADVVFDCRGKSLKETPKDIPANVTVLLLSDNNINPIKPMSHLTVLRILDISRNIIAYLKSDSLTGLVALEELYLQGNRLHPSGITYPESVFKDLANLRVLDVQKNYNLTSSRVEYPDIAFGKLPSLTDLRIDGLRGLKFGPGFTNLKHLVKLTVGGAFGFCNLTGLANNTFHNLPVNLQWLDVSQCELWFVEPHAFMPFEHLKYLDLSFTFHIELMGFVNLTYSLMFTPVVTLNISRFQSGGYISLQPSHFRYLVNTSVEELILDFNHIIYIDPASIGQFPPNLTYLSLRDNNINSARALRNFHLLQNLRNIDVSYQFHDTDQVTKKYRNLALPFGDPTNKTSKKFLVPPNLEYIYANHLKLRYPIPSLTFSENKVKVIDMSFNGFTSWIGKLYGLHSLELINVSNNNMMYISRMALGDIYNLKHLLLSENRFGDSLYQDKLSLTFSNQTKLEILDLSSNEIKSLPRNIFRSQVSLHELILRNNSLTSVDFFIGHMKALTVLDLSFNQLVSLTTETCAELDQIAAIAPTTVRLQGNSLQCSCGEIEFLEWLLQTDIKIDYRTYECKFKNSSYVSMSHVEELIHALKIECIADQLVEACVFVFIFILLLLVIPIIIYHKRWKLRYLFYVGRRNTNPYHRLDGNIRPASDAYICYAHTSYDFVVNNLRNALIPKGLTISGEEQLSFNGPMARCISDAIKESNKVVALLTKEYFRDQWAIFGFHIAVQEGIYARREVLIPVIMEDLDVRAIPDDIILILKSITCLVFPLNGREDIFWELLEARIRE